MKLKIKTNDKKKTNRPKAKGLGMRAQTNFYFFKRTYDLLSTLNIFEKE